MKKIIFMLLVITNQSIAQIDSSGVLSGKEIKANVLKETIDKVNDLTTIIEDLKKSKSVGINVNYDNSIINGALVSTNNEVGDNWVASVIHEGSLGNTYLVNFTSNYWKTTPLCKVSANLHDPKNICLKQTEHINFLRIACFIGDAPASAPFTVKCVGEKN